MPEKEPSPNPSRPSPEIEPSRRTQPEIFPQKSPDIPQKTSPEFVPSPDNPEIQPEPSPDATPPQREIEIAPLNDPIDPPSQP
jgi:hypothetical protein